jgi:hypothetical protein
MPSSGPVLVAIILWCICLNFSCKPTSPASMLYNVYVITLGHAVA